MSENMAYKYRLIPTETQKADLKRRIAVACRAWNFMLERYNALPKDLKPSEKHKIIRIEYKEYLRLEENEWQHIANKRYYEYLTQNFKAAWSKYWEAFKKGDVGRAQARYKHRCEESGKKFNQKRYDNFYKPQRKYFMHDNLTYQTDAYGSAEIDIPNGLVKIDKAGEWIKFKIKPDDKIFLEKIIKVGALTFSRSPSGKYYLSVAIESDREQQEAELNTAVGVDFGVNDYAVLSTGIKINLRSTDKITERIKLLQQRVSRKYECNKDNKDWQRKNYNKLQRRIKRLIEKRANIRKYDTHHYTKFITDNFDIIGIEDLNVKGMTAKAKPKKNENGKGFAKNRKKAKSGLTRKILNNNPHETARQLEYKAAWKGKLFGKADRFFASSKTCNVCGEKNTELKLADRDWACTGCGMVHNRDLNAGLNIRDNILSQAEVNAPDLNQNAFQFSEDILSIKEEINTQVQLQFEKPSVNGRKVAIDDRRQNGHGNVNPELCKFLASTHLQIEKVGVVIAPG